MAKMAEKHTGLKCSMAKVGRGWVEPGTRREQRRVRRSPLVRLAALVEQLHPTLRVLHYVLVHAIPPPMRARAASAGGLRSLVRQVHRYEVHRRAPRELVGSTSKHRAARTPHELVEHRPRHTASASRKSQVASRIGP